MVLRVLEAAEKSQRAGGREIKIPEKTESMRQRGDATNAATWFRASTRNREKPDNDPVH